VGPWTLGAAGPTIAWTAVGWTAVVFLVCALADPLALEMFGGLGVALALVWLAVVRSRFAGPHVDLAQFERD
jgi:hypothetical protein